MHCLGQMIGSDFVFLPVQDERWHMYLVEPVHTVIGSCCLELADGGIIRMRTSNQRYFQHEIDLETRPGHRSPFQALHDRRNEDQAFDLLGMLECEGRGNAPSHGCAEKMRLCDAQRMQQSGSVVSHHFDGVGDIRLVGLSHATVIERDDLIAFRESGNNSPIQGMSLFSPAIRTTGSPWPWIS